MHKLSNFSDLSVTIQCNFRNIYLDFLELNVSFFIQYQQATQRGNVECITILLIQGANSHLSDLSGNTVLHRTVSRDNTKIASKLLEYKSDIEAKTEVNIIQPHPQCTSRIGRSDPPITCQSSSFDQI